MVFRPEIDTLRFLSKYCDLGIYTSMTEKNAQRVLDALRAQYPGIFEVGCIFLHRFHTITVGRPLPWSTVKPIRKWFATTDVWLVDDTIEKALPEESQHFVVVPTWTGDEGDAVLSGVVTNLVQKLGIIAS